MVFVPFVSFCRTLILRVLNQDRSTGWGMIFTEGNEENKGGGGVALLPLFYSSVPSCRNTTLTARFGTWNPAGGSVFVPFVSFCKTLSLRVLNQDRSTVPFTRPCFYRT